MQPGVAGEFRMKRCHHHVTLSSHDGNTVVFGHDFDVGADGNDLRGRG